MAPISTRVEVVRSGRRVATLRAELLSGEEVVAIAHGSLLAESDVASTEYPAALSGPEGLQNGKLLPDAAFEAIGRGFHSSVDVRWVRHDRPCAAWFRLPGPMVEGERPCPFVRAAALSDFVNALTSLGSTHAAFINTDTTVYFGRAPTSDWIGLMASGAVDSAGVGFGEALLFDDGACFGRAVQARLANSSAWRG
jgi:acyl-CoA thioesterase